MSFFSIGNSADRYGVIIDIGSGSVLTAIVHSNPSKTHPQIVWSHREHALLRDIDSLEQSAKAVMTALVNASMQLDAEGRKVLYEYDKKAKLSEIQCSISAPWSYTVTKNINYNQEFEFEVTEDLIDELIDTIQNKITTDVKENETLLQLGLQVVSRMNMSLLVNGYRIENPYGGKAKSITISRTNVVSQKYLIDAIDEMNDKLFREANCHKISFILMLYSVTKSLFKQTHDVSLIDITDEATEIGVVRDGVLTYCTHAPFGAFSLAREISNITKVPLHEAFGYLHTEKPYTFMDTLTKSQKDEVELVFESYISKITSLFQETGDALSIPKQISLHSDLNSEALFMDLLDKAVKRSIKTEPNIVSISSEIIAKTYKSSTSDTTETIPIDTALLLSAQFFHTTPNQSPIEYL